MRNKLVVLFAALLFCTSAFAQAPKSTLTANVSSSFPDNSVGGITPAILRTFFNSLIASFQQFAGVNAQVGTTYTVQASDYGQLVSFSNAAPVAVSLPGAGSANFSPFSFYALNKGAGTVTITPSIGTINGAANFALVQNQSIFLVSDGTNWQIIQGVLFQNPGFILSWNGRLGPAITPAIGDYTTQQLTTNITGSAPSCGSGKIGELCSVSTLNNTSLVTFTNGSANILWLAGTVPAVGSVVEFTTTGALPTNFAISTVYYVVSSISTTIQVSATVNGTAIVAGSAGSGSQTGHANVTLAATGTTNVAYLLLAAGDWRCSGNIGFTPAGSTTVSSENASVSSTSATATTAGMLGATVSVPNPAAGLSVQSLPTGDFDFPISTPTLLYAVGSATFATSTMVFYGTMACRRMS